MENTTKNILLVEMDSSAAVLLKEQLERNGYNITSASSLTEVIGLLEKNFRPDVILMDIDSAPDMPMDIPYIYEIPVIFTYSAKKTENILKTEVIKPCGYLEKFSDISIIDASIKTALRLFNAGKNREGENINPEEPYNNNLLLSLQERVKELTCLFAVNREINIDIPVDVFFQRVIEHLVKAFQFSEIAVPSIEMEGKRYTTARYREGLSNYIRSLIEINGMVFGYLYVYYIEDKPFLIPEEENLVKTVAGILAKKLLFIKTEINLKESEQVYRKIFHDHSAVKLMIDPDSGRIIDANKAASEFYGWSRDDLMQMNISNINILSPNEIRKEMDLAKKLKRLQFHFRHRLADGTIRDVEVFSSGITVSGKSILHSIVHDVTERKKSESALKRQSEINEQLFTASKLILKAGDFEATARNIFNAVCLLTGATSGYVALLSENGDENDVLFLESGGYNCTVDPTLPMPIRGLRGEAYRTGKPVFDNSFDSSHWIKFLPEGHSPLYNVLFAPLMIDDKAAGLLGIANKPAPFTEEDARLAEIFAGLAAIALNNSRNLQLLKESETRFKALHNASFGGLIVHDKGMILDCNQGLADITGFSVSELIGMNGLLLIAERDRDQVMKNIISGYEKPYETTGLRKNGEEYPVLITGKNIPYKGKTVRSTEFRDITEVRIANQKIHNLLGEKELILKETHHRIKNNMNTIYGLLFLQAEAQDNHECGDILTDAASRVQSMMILYDRLYQSEVHDKLDIRQYIPPLVDEIIGVFNSPIPLEKAIDIESIVLSARILMPLGIMINELITNSMKYAFKGIDKGVIGISVSKNNEMVKLTYSDNGRGLPQDTTFKNSKGFGMQLISMLADQIGGTLNIGKEEGIKIILEFPCERKQ